MIDLKGGNKEVNYKISDYPKNYKIFGAENEGDCFKIFIDEITLEKIDEYLSTDIENELGGVLVGDVCINSDKEKFILIVNFIIAEHTNSSLSRLTFTHETWGYINENLERNFPEKKIIGWFHSHPGHTVFLSNFDIFIQENFFNADYMVAYVFDPTIKDRGFFFWKDKQIVKSKGYYIFNIKKKGDPNEFANFINDMGLTEFKGSDREKNNNSTDFRNTLIVGVLALNLLLLILILYNYYDLNKKILLREDYSRNLLRIEEDTKAIKEKLESMIRDNEPKSDLVESIDTLSTPYIVKDEDTLERIAFQFYKNRSMADMIIKRNNLRNKWDIKPGQTLLIPKPSE